MILNPDDNAYLIRCLMKLGTFISSSLDEGLTICDLNLYILLSWCNREVQYDQ